MFSLRCKTVCLCSYIISCLSSHLEQETTNMYWLNISFHSVHLKRQHNMLKCRWFAWITMGDVEVNERKNRPCSQWSAGESGEAKSKCQVQRVRKAINHWRDTREGESRWGGGDPTVDQRICVYVPIVCCPGSLCFAGSLHAL